jgi:hypothetical protein
MNAMGILLRMYELRREPPQSPLTRLYLAVTRSAPDMFNFGIVLVSEDLKQGVEGSFWWYEWYEFDKEGGSDEDKPKSDSKPSPSEASQPSVVQVEWSELSRQFIEAYRAVERTAEPIAFADVVDPAKVEPLSLVPTDVLRAYARQKGKPVIALIPDSLVWWLVGAVGGRDMLQ